MRMKFAISSKKRREDVLKQSLYPLSRIFIPAFLKTLFLVHGVSWCSCCSWCSPMRTIKKEDDCVCRVSLRDRQIFGNFFLFFFCFNYILFLYLLISFIRHYRQSIQQHAFTINYYCCSCSFFSSPSFFVSSHFFSIFFFC